MQLVFIDETSDSKFKDYFGLSVATINYTKYSKVKTKFQKILRKSNWDESIEFKGSCLFSAKSGDINVPITERIEIAEKIIKQNIAKSNARMNFHYLRHNVDPKEHGKEYLRLLPLLLSKALPKAPSGAGKNLVSITCDYHSDIHIQSISEALLPVIEQKKYVSLEEPTMVTSNFHTVGVLFADIVGHLAARIDTISNDAELFEGIPPEQFESNGKIRKLKASANLISQVKNSKLTTNRFGSKYIYYHCTHRKTGYHCRQGSVELQGLEAQIIQFLKTITIPDELHDLFMTHLEKGHKRLTVRNQAKVKSLQTAIATVSTKKKNLTHIRLQGMIDDDEFLESRNQLDFEEKNLAQQLEQAKNPAPMFEPFKNHLEFCNKAVLWFKEGNPETKRLILKTVCSNPMIRDKIFKTEAAKPFLVVPKNAGLRFLRAVGSNFRKYNGKNACGYGFLGNKDWKNNKPSDQNSCL